MKFPKPYVKNRNSVHVIIETPYKSRNKFDFDKSTGFFKLKKVLPAGMEFPCDMGFIPSTRGEDGAPLDALILMDAFTYPGCLVECRLLGVIKADQKEKGKKKFRNDRFIAVPANISDYADLKNISDVNRHKLQAIVRFFENYNEQEDRKFIARSIQGSAEAHKLLKKYKNK
jgi:inorganic pyrophosphatase